MLLSSAGAVAMVVPSLVMVQLSAEKEKSRPFLEAWLTESRFSAAVGR